MYNGQGTKETHRVDARGARISVSMGPPSRTGGRQRQATRIRKGLVSGGPPQFQMQVIVTEDQVAVELWPSGVQSERTAIKDVKADVLGHCSSAATGRGWQQH